ncbi:hypothetical protein BDU57DRAFT_596109 [Ampelomyces quisqualis]|uniref:Uncharacterized protein n=1 Tax=Ampelomyces quisqualis TaxID=50730 RepID=A0A6A5QL77_AMPQU|nr:hypothetical protein BDU57DRAFT_596109 [Ampelomyces quisqualis]
MSTQPLVPPPLPRQLVRFMRRLEAKLTQGNLLRVLETLPTATTIKFYESTLLGQSAIRAFVGYRTQDDGSKAKTWAYVLLNHDAAEPAVVFRDVVSQVDDQVVSHHRSATSLLRRAGELLPPFCFLQFESNEETRHVRDMICALVLYYALTTGIADSATRWAKFEISLIEALRYIQNSADYQDWQAEQHDPTKISEATAQRADVFPGNDSLPDEAHDDVSTAPMRGGVVRSFGRSIVATPGTAFAKLKDALGHRDHFLDAIPFTAVTIERQEAFPDYFPFRLHLGTYRNANVYVYLVPEVRSYVKILAEPGDDNMVHEWIFNDLSDPELHLSQPFDFFMSKHSQDLATRGLRVRYFVYYYYMLAENQGLISDPELRIAARTMLPKFIAGCKDLREARHGVDITDSAKDSADEERATEQLEAVSVRIRPLATSKSLIIKLRVDPHVLAIMTGPAFPYKHPRICTGQSKQISNCANAEDIQQDDLISGVEHEDVPTTHEAVVESDSLAQASTLEEINASIREEDVKIQEMIIARANSRDSALGSSRKSSAAGIPDFVAASSWQKNSSIRTRSTSDLIETAANDDSDSQNQGSATDIQMPEAEEDDVVERNVVQEEGVKQQSIAQDDVEQEVIMSDIVEREIIKPQVFGQEAVGREFNSQENGKQDVIEQDSILQGIVEQDIDQQDSFKQTNAQPEAIEEEIMQPEIVEAELAILNIANRPDLEMSGTVLGENKSTESSERPSKTPALELANSVVVNLCSDDDDDMDSDTPKSEVEGTPGIEEVVRPHQQIDGDDGHTLGRQKRVLSKKREYFYISSDNEDVMVKEQDGHAWKRASLGQSQEHPLILD